MRYCKSEAVVAPRKSVFVDYKHIPPSEDDKKHESLSDTYRRKCGIKQVDKGVISTVKIL